MNFIKKFKEYSNIQINDIKFNYSKTFTKEFLRKIDLIYIPKKCLESDKECA